MSDNDIETFSDAGPDLEDIAALIDGRLEGPERDRVVALLAEDEASYEVFAEALRVQEELSEAPPLESAGEEGGTVADVVPIERPAQKVRPRPGRRWLPAARRWRSAVTVAAAAALLIVIMGALWRQQQQMFWSSDRALTVAGLRPGSGSPPPGSGETGSKGPDDEWYRGGKIQVRGEAPSSASDRADFQLGAQTIDLHIALTFADRPQAKSALQRMDKLLEERALYLEQTDVQRFQATVEQTSDLRALRDESTRLEQELRQSVGGLYFDLGVWVEAARLAALVGEREYFAHRKSRSLQKQLRKEDLVKTADTVQQICKLAAETGASPDGSLDEVIERLNRLARWLGAPVS